MNTMYTAKRIQRQRTKGWRKPKNTVWVGRAGRGKPGKWGNPFETINAGGTYTNEEAVTLYEGYVKDRHDQIRKELKGKNIMCYCAPDEVCHADVLIRIANQ